MGRSRTHRLKKYQAVGLGQEDTEGKIAKIEKRKRFSLCLLSKHRLGLEEGHPANK